jgi:hypothetical protein
MGTHRANQVIRQLRKTVLIDGWHGTAWRCRTDGGPGHAPLDAEQLP